MSLLSPITEQDKVDFAKNLSVMLKSGIAINVALSALGDQARSRKFQSVIYTLRDDIESGTLLSSAFKKRKNYFGSVFISLIQAGETSGTLQKNLHFLAQWFERSADLKREVSAATMYPKLIFTATLFLGGALVIFILPKLVPVFGQLQVELPLMTRLLLSVSTFVQAYWFLFLLLIVALFLGYMYMIRIPRIRYTVHTVYLRTPLLGNMLKNYQLALITELYTTLLRSGLTINRSVEIVRNSVTNALYEKAMEQMQRDIEEGVKLSTSMEKNTFLFPKMVTNIVLVGEKSGTLSDSFSYLAEFYTKEVNAQAKKLPTIIEPLLLGFIAVTVGFIALAIIMPIYELTGSIA